ncbi:hypothetical protein L873DRAFT_622002 [Choiromyces venosus 120613-1]|uniref:Uncharacterized protein n=1 Tax=Choiromyces venosus 120613-1 TaxID=1336337 RepID=A0A3N4IZE6_9PEZI|nr:hypothetical protein L873DRAFT_622002 [Choiromyces venosus 120613-1]
MKLAYEKMLHDTRRNFNHPTTWTGINMCYKWGQIWGGNFSSFFFSFFLFFSGNKVTGMYRTRNFLTFVNTTAIAYRRNLEAPAHFLPMCNTGSSCVSPTSENYEYLLAKIHHR